MTPSTAANSLTPASALEILVNLSDRVAALEQSRHACKLSRSPALTSHNSPVQAVDPFACRIMVQALAAGLTDSLFVRCPPDYYDWPLESRRVFLNAPAQAHLSKSIVLQNVRLVDEDAALQPWKYICCVVPYAFKIDPDAVKAVVRDTFVQNAPSASKFNFRLAHDCVQVTGYEPNAVTPLGLHTPMPILLHDTLNRLDPAVFWLGGGQVSLKWRVRLDQFHKAFSPLVARIAVPE